MFSFMSPDSKFMQLLNLLTELVILNLVYLLTCLPIFTIGAANAALYTITFRMARNRDSHIVRSYFRAFRDNFKQGTLIWLLLLIIGLPTVYYCFSFFLREDALRYLFVVFFTILAVTLFAGSYVFPWISQFQNDTPTSLRNSLILSLSHLPHSLGVAVINLLPVGMLLVSPELFIQVSFLWFILYFSAAAYVNTGILLKVFKPYYPEEQ